MVRAFLIVISVKLLLCCPQCIRSALIGFQSNETYRNRIGFRGHGSKVQAYFGRNERIAPYAESGEQYLCRIAIPQRQTKLDLSAPP